MTTQPNAVAFPDGSVPTRNLDKFFAEHRAAGQDFTIDPTRRTTLVGSQGTRLTIAPNAFLDSSGWPVRGQVILSLREVFSRLDMVLSGLTNTSEDRILESAGQLLLKAHGEEDQLSLAIPIAIDLPLQSGLDNPLASQLFSGGVSQTSSFGSGLRFDWKSVKTKNIQLKTLGDRKYLHFLIDELNWWNCTSFFHRRRSRIMMSLRWSAAGQPVEDLAAFLVFQDFNAVVRMYPSRHGFSSWNIPKEVTARVILLGYSGEQLLMGKSPWAPTSSQPIHVELENTSKDAVLALMPEYCL